MIRLQVQTDGRRDCIERTIESATDMLEGPITERVIHDDSGDPSYRAWLVERFDNFDVIGGPDRAGFGGAIIGAWRHIAVRSLAWWVFWLEDDFTFNRSVDLSAMAAVLAVNPHLAQMALRRQSWNARERSAGGVIECEPDEYVEQCDPSGNRWLEHRLFWTTNPSLFSVDLVAAGWPTGAHSEGRFTHSLLSEGLRNVAGADVRFGYWGARDSGEAVTHIGVERVGSDY